MNHRTAINLCKALQWLALLCPATGWTYSCNLAIGPVTALYNGNPVNVPQTAEVRCVREPQEWPGLWVRLQADLGSHPIDTQPFRTVRRGNDAHALAYALTRSMSLGNCETVTNWLAPGGTITENTMLEPIIWSSNTTLPASRTLHFCVKVLGPARFPSALPAHGTYQDRIQITADFNDRYTFAYSDLKLLPAPIVVTVPVLVQVDSHCRLEPPLHPLNLRYVSFSGDEVVGSTKAHLTCSTGLLWRATIDPPDGTLAGLPYTLSLRTPGIGVPISSRISTGLVEPIEIVGRVAAGLSGTCGTGHCTASRTHTLTISY